MISKLTPQQINSVMQIWLTENINAHGFIPQSYWQNNYEAVKLLLPKSQVFVYHDGDIVKGFAGITDEHIEGLFVAKEYQSNGIGSSLIEYCKQHYLKLSLNVYAQNTRAVGFYKKHGFRIEAEKICEHTKAAEYSMQWCKTKYS